MKTWGIYYRDREYAREHGDPMLATVRAETKEEAEQIAREAFVQDSGAGLWAAPIDGEKERELLRVLGSRTLAKVTHITLGDHLKTICPICQQPNHPYDCR